MSMNLAAILDEFIVLHAGVASTLLGEFPDAYGARFMLDSDTACALPMKNVPRGVAPEYQDTAFESRSEELLAIVAPRMGELLESVASLGITRENFLFTAQRVADTGGFEDTCRVVGAVSGGVGAVVVQREMLACDDSIFAHVPAEFNIIGIVEDGAALPAVEEASKGGLLSALNHLVDTELLLSAPFTDASPLRDWIDHFPVKDGSCAVRSKHPVCRVVARSDYRPVIIYVTDRDVEGLDGNTGKIVSFDRERGFNVFSHASPATAPKP